MDNGDKWHRHRNEVYVYQGQPQQQKNTYCKVQSSTRSYPALTVVTHTSTATTTTSTSPGWVYQPVQFDIFGLKNGTTFNSAVNLPLGSSGAMTAIAANGCIEERATVKQSSYWPIPAGAKDLNIDLIPQASDVTTQWAPSLPNAVYLRKDANGNHTTDTAYAGSHPATYCPQAAHKLTTWPDPTAFDSYVDGLSPSGNTYHDIGMLWGARLISPTGIFASENALTPAGGSIERHVIFMTDGNAQGAPSDYNAYGVPWWDKRTTNDVGAASACGSDNANLDTQINVRLEALCNAVKNMGHTTLWVISFGAGTDDATKTRLSNCATSGRYFSATNSTVLQQTFRSIADQISQLRLTQ